MTKFAQLRLFGLSAVDAPLSAKAVGHVASNTIDHECPLCGMILAQA